MYRDCREGWLSAVDRISQRSEGSWVFRDYLGMVTSQDVMASWIGIVSEIKLYFRVTSPTKIATEPILS